MAFYPDERIAVFVDGANLYSAGRNLDFDIDYKKFLDLFKSKGRLITANYYTALLENDDYSPIRPLIDWLDYNGWQVITRPAKEYTDRDGRRRIKGDMDVDIAVDMLEMAPYVDHIILCSGDGDFRPLVKAVQKKGVRVTIVSTAKAKPPMLSDELKRQADAVIDLADLDEKVGRPKREYSDYEDDH